MRPIYLTQTGVGTTSAIPLDHYISPFNVNVGMIIQSGAATFTLEYTLDDVAGPLYQNNQQAAPPVTWLPFASATGLVASTVFPITQPVMALRLNVSASTGAVRLIVLQAGQSGV
jgi:hypothetical protein